MVAWFRIESAHAAFQIFSARDFFAIFEAIARRRFLRAAACNHRRTTRTDEDFRGTLLLIYFGYSYCPDVCPTDLQQIGERALFHDAELPWIRIPLAGQCK